ncbi:MAG: hypothetical protein E7496_01390 [Ruminococcus sp.]|nr:hypothetical protein [Ruminococcus sp.]
METDFLYSDDNQKHDIFLHDAIAESVSVHDDVMTFYFPEGFYLGETHALNPFHVLAYTGESEMKMQLRYKNPDVNLTIYLFREGADGTHRQEISLQEFLKLIKKGEKLEFLNAYQGLDTDSVLYQCELHFDRAPYRRECMLIISYQTISYHWNEIFQENS